MAPGPSQPIGSGPDREGHRVDPGPPELDACLGTEPPLDARSRRPTPLDGRNGHFRPRRWLNPAVFDFWARHLNRTWSAERILARVIERRTVSSRATTLVLKPNRHWPGARAGQHLDVLVDIAGVRHQRCYSLSAPPRADGCIEITVAEVEGGKVSPVLARTLRIGDVIELGVPYGGLILLPHDNGRSVGSMASDTAPAQASCSPRRGEETGERGATRDASTVSLSPTGLRFAPAERGLKATAAQASVLLLAAGSGITPLRALLLDALAQGNTRPITLAYWAQTADEICFHDEWRQLVQQHPNLRVELRLTRDPQQPAARIDAAQLRAFAPDLAGLDVLACGPEGFIRRARALCATARSFQAEGFSASVVDVPEGEAASSVRVQLKRSGLALDLPADRPLLQALEEAGQTPAFGCRRGICNTCSCDRLSGASRDLQSGAIASEPATPIRLCVHSAAQGLVLDL